MKMVYIVLLISCLTGLFALAGVIIGARISRK